LRHLCERKVLAAEVDVSLKQKRGSAAAEGTPVGASVGASVEASVGSEVGAAVLSLTELEASLVPAEPAMSERELAASYLQSIVPTDKSAPRWLQAVAEHVPRMQRWWRCVSSRLVDSPKERAIRQDNLGFMLQAIVESDSVGEQAVILQSLRDWGTDWRDREGHLEGAMTE
jgi:hypothetical protein